VERDQHAWRDAQRQATSGQRILLGAGYGGQLASTRLESLLGVALTLRGANASVLLCDAALTACLACNAPWYPHQRVFVRHGPARDLCRHCFEPAARMYASLGFRVHRYSDYLDAQDLSIAADVSTGVPLSEMSSFRYEGIQVGEHALAGAVRFFARTSLECEPSAEAVLRRYLQAAILTALAIRRLVRSEGIDCAVFDHGIYVPNGVVGEVCRTNGVRVVNWAVAYRTRCFIFSHDDTYHRTMMHEPVEVWDELAWTAALDRQIMDYLRTRWYGTEDWVRVHELLASDARAAIGDLGIDFSKPCIGLLTNVMWDARVNYAASVFRDMKEWVLTTVGYFALRADLQLIIRVHPAERHGTQQRIDRDIREAFPTLPQNVIVIPPESPLSTYAVMERCNAALIYATKTGVELTSFGIPTIVAGEAWIRNKAITMDANSKDEYMRLLSSLPVQARLSQQAIERARKYAYHFFFRRMIPVEAFTPTLKDAPYAMSIRGLDDLLPGHSAGLDVICNGILDGTPFIYHAETEAATAEYMHR
jgi:hypothetical protein